MPGSKAKVLQLQDPTTGLAAPAPPPPASEVLLTAIRDLLKKS